MVIRIVETLAAAGVLLRALRRGIDRFTRTSRKLAGILASLADYERELMHERTAARLRGRHTGRPPRLTPAQARQVRDDHVGLRRGGVSRSTGGKTALTAGSGAVRVSPPTGLESGVGSPRSGRG